MIVVSNRIPVAKGHEEAFAERFRNRASLVEHHPGFVRLEILRPQPISMHGQGNGQLRLSRCPDLLGNGSRFCRVD